MSLRQTEITDEQTTTEYCTCGAKLVERARFCHMCGRPAFEIPTVEPGEAERTAPLTETQQSGTAGPVLPGVAQLPVSFSNPIALRVAILMALGIMLTTVTPFLNMLLPVWWLAAGTCGVLLYRRMTGLSLDVRAGARLGSITGVLAFLCLVIIIGLMLAATGNEVFQEMIKQNPDASQVLNNPPALAMAALLALLILFAMVVGICAAGGALGARLASRNAKV